MAVAISDAAASAAAAAVLALVDGGVGAGTLEIRTGAAPATPETADAGTLLVSLDFSDPAFGAPTAGVATANDIPAENAVATGTAGHFRVKDSAGVVVMQGNVTAVGGGGDMELVTTSITSGQPVEITAFTYTQPKS